MSEEMNLYKRCKNIFKAHGVDMGGGGESAPEVENAIETHGLGWTSEEEIPAIDITWDGNTEGLERSVDGQWVKISDLDIPNDQIVGLKYDSSRSDTHEVYDTYEMTPEMFEQIAELGFINDDYAFVDYWFIVHKDGIVVDDSEFTHKGIYVNDPETVEAYISHIYKEATTEEVVHQIDQKYIPGGSGGGSVLYVDVTINDSTGEATSDVTLFDIQAAFNSGAGVIAKVDIGGYNMFLPLISYIESDRALPFEVVFGAYAYNADDESNSPLLKAQLDMDGDTNWTLNSF